MFSDNGGELVPPQAYNQPQPHSSTQKQSFPQHSPLIKVGRDNQQVDTVTSVAMGLVGAGDGCAPQGPAAAAANNRIDVKYAISIAACVSC